MKTADSLGAKAHTADCQPRVLRSQGGVCIWVMGVIDLAATQEEDYVTEKFAQALVAGSVPVVIGAPNIEEFAVAPHSMIVLRSKEASPAPTAQYKPAAGIYRPFAPASRRKTCLRPFHKYF